MILEVNLYAVVMVFRSCEIERTAERYINEGIAQDFFVKHAENYKLDKQKLLKMYGSESGCSSPENSVGMALDYAVNLTKIRYCGDFIKKQRLQYFLLPDGLT